MNRTSSWGWIVGQSGYQTPQCVLLQVTSPGRSDQFGLIRDNERVMTNPVVINHSSKTVCNSENCALGKFTVKCLRNITGRSSGFRQLLSDSLAYEFIGGVVDTDAWF